MLFLLQIVTLAASGAAFPSALYINSTGLGAHDTAIAASYNSPLPASLTLSTSTANPPSLGIATTSETQISVSSAGFSSSSTGHLFSPTLAAQSEPSSGTTTTLFRFVLSTRSRTRPANSTQTYPCNCGVVIPKVSYVTWVPNSGSGPTAAPQTNAAGTSTTVILTYGAGYNGDDNIDDGELTLAFPTLHYDYPNDYHFYGTIPAVSAGTTSCSSVLDINVFGDYSYLPSHPTYSGHRLPQPTVPANDSLGLHYTPVWVTTAKEDAWVLSRFPSVPILQLCEPGIEITLGQAHPAKFKPTVSKINAPSSGPVAEPEQTPAPALPAQTSPLEVLTSANGHMNAPIATFDSSAQPEVVHGGMQTPSPSPTHDAGLETPETPQGTVSLSGDAVQPALASPTSRFDLGAVIISAAQQAPSASAAGNAPNLQVGEQPDNQGYDAIQSPVPHFSYDPAFVIASVTLTASSGQYRISNRPLTPGASIAFGSGASATAIVVTTDSRGVTVIQIGTTTVTLSGASAAQATPGAFMLAGETLYRDSNNLVVGGQTLHFGTPATITQSGSTQIVSMQTNSAGLTEIAAGSVTATLAAAGTGRATFQATAQPAKFTFAGHTLTLAGGAVIVQGQTLSLQTTATLRYEAQATTVALQIDASGRSELVIDGSTTDLPETTPAPQAVVTYAGLTLTELSSAGGIAVEGHTMRPGASVTLGSGPQVTIVAIHTNAFRQTEIAVDGSKTTLPPPSSSIFTFAEQTFTEMTNGEIFVQGETLSFGKTVTLSDGTYAAVVGMQRNAVGATELVVGASTTVLQAIATAALITAAGLTFTAAGSGALAVRGQALSRRSTIILGDGTQTAYLVLETNRLGQTELVQGSSTLVLSSSEGVGGYIMSGLGGTLSTTASQTIEPGPIVTWSSVQSSPSVMTQSTGGGSRLGSTGKVGATFAVLGWTMWHMYR